MTGEVRKRDRQGTMQKLLDAALQVFSELGFDGATTKLVAKRADVTESLIVKYFGSKRGLLLALFEDFHLRRTEAEKEPYAEGKDLADEFAIFLDRQFEMTLCTKEFTRIILGNASVDETMRKALSAKVPLDWHPILKERLRKYRDRGVIAPDTDLDQIVFTLGFQTFAASYVGHMLLEMDENEVRAKLHRFVKTYAAGLVAEGERVRGVSRT